MSGRRAYSMPARAIDSKPERGKCIAAICFSWKVITCIVSHVTLVLMVVSYCVGGAYLFQYLEKPHEIEIKKDIHNMRRSLTDRIWQFSDNSTYLYENEWMAKVGKDLASFETQILTAMKADGWDGDEDVNKTQWTFAGSLFYSIIVITTIGYGHISPRTDWGKVTTIFYAIVGIPLMLLCLSNIGDIMATSFRFVYWRVCCYICTRSSHRNSKRTRSRQRSVRSHRYTSRSQPPPSFRRSMKLTQRSANDSGVGTSLGGMAHAYSDPELRTVGRNGYDYDYRGSSRRRHPHKASLRQSAPMHMTVPYYNNDPYNDENSGHRNYGRYSGRQRNRFRMQERHTIERERNLGRSKPYIDSIEELNGSPPPRAGGRESSAAAGPPIAKRSFSFRSTRGRREETIREGPEARELHELNPVRMQSPSLAQPPRGRSVPHNIAGRGMGRAKSVDPRAARYEDLDDDVIRRTPIIPNRYALEEFDERQNRRDTKNAKLRSQSMPRSAQQRRSGYNSRIADHEREASPQDHRHNGRGQSQQRDQRDQHGDRAHREQRHLRTRSSQQPPARPSVHRQQSRYGNRLELPELTSSNNRSMRRSRSRSHSPCPDEYAMDNMRRGRSPRRGNRESSYDDRYMDDYDVEAGYDDYTAQEMHHRERKHLRRELGEKLPPSPRIMSPMGFAVKRQIRRRPSYDNDEESIDEWIDYYGDILPKNRPVPIWLCVFLVISYILGGAALFAHWEKWSFLDSAYFCFITLTTIGFGDFVPAKGVQDESEPSIAYCSLYLLFGISLLAMSFNLVQEEFIANVKEVARRLGILKDDEEEED